MPFPRCDQVAHGFAVATAFADHPVDSGGADLIEVVGIGENLGFDQIAFAIARLPDGGRGPLDNASWQDALEMHLDPIGGHIAAGVGRGSQQQFIATQLTSMNLQDPAGVMV